jgi:hypothetical protein
MQPTINGAMDTEADTRPGMKRLLHDSSWYLVANVAQKIIGFVMIPFYASYLSAEQYGVLNLLELATTIVAIGFGLQALGQALTRIYHDQTGEAERRNVVSTAVLGTIALAGAIAALASLAAGPIADCHVHRQHYRSGAGVRAHAEPRALLSRLFHGDPGRRPRAEHRPYWRRTSGRVGFCV